MHTWGYPAQKSVGLSSPEVCGAVGQKSGAIQPRSLWGCPAQRHKTNSREACGAIQPKKMFGECVEACGAIQQKKGAIQPKKKFVEACGALQPKKCATSMVPAAASFCFPAF